MIVPFSDWDSFPFPHDLSTSCQFPSVLLQHLSFESTATTAYPDWANTCTILIHLTAPQHSQCLNFHAIPPVRHFFSTFYSIFCLYLPVRPFYRAFLLRSMVMQSQIRTVQESTVSRLPTLHKRFNLFRIQFFPFGELDISTHLSPILCPASDHGGIGNAR